MNRLKKIFITLAAAAFLPGLASAQAGTTPSTSASEPVAIIMLSIALLLVAVILVLSRVVFASYDIYKKKNKENQAGAAPLLTIALLLFSEASFAQDAAPVALEAPGLIGGLSQTSFYFLLSVIVLELIIIFFLVRTFRLFAGLKKSMAVVDEQLVAEKEKKKSFKWLEKLNNTKSVDAASEAEINLGHDYDGIGELDNPTPPWWQWGFVISVIFAGIYMYTHHVSKSAPLQLQELAIANEKADKQQAAFLANSANKLDEHNVTLLTENSDLLEGKTIFTAVCSACHGVDGGGTVGPNLTDEYWLHGGDIKDIFKTIKYGVPEKGMKSWKDDYSPKKIAQIASFIVSLQGTKPADPKAPQGEKYATKTGDAVAHAD